MTTKCESTLGTMLCFTQSDPKFTGSFTKTVYITKNTSGFCNGFIFITSLPSRVAANTTGGGSYDKQMAT